MARSSIASGAPPRITRAKPAPSTTDQRHLPSLMMCNTARSIQGMATNPSVMSRWLTWLNTVPGEGEGESAQQAGHGGERQGSQEDVHADADTGEEHDFSGDPGDAIGEDDEEPDQRVEGPGVEPGQQRGAAVDVLVPERQLAVPDHGSGQHVQRIVLLHVVAGQQQMPAEEIGQDESSGRNGDQDEIGPPGTRMRPESIHLGMKQ